MPHLGIRADRFILALFSFILFFSTFICLTYKNKVANKLPYVHLATRPSALSLLNILQRPTMSLKHRPSRGEKRQLGFSGLQPQPPVGTMWRSACDTLDTLVYALEGTLALESGWPHQALGRLQGPKQRSKKKTHFRPQNHLSCKVLRDAGPSQPGSVSRDLGTPGAANPGHSLCICRDSHACRVL